MRDTRAEISSDFEGLVKLMSRLRDPNHGCPWDVEQTFKTIAPYTIEEAYEVDEAIQLGDLNALKEELGDLLFQVVFHSQMASEENAFSINDVVGGIVEKMVRRHPHVFESPDNRNAVDQTIAWEEMKASERANKNSRTDQVSTMDGVASALPALLRAEKLQKRAARDGFDWAEVGPIFEKLDEETAELKAAIASQDRDNIAEELGDLLFVVANLARRLEVNPETSLRRANEKFERRYRKMEQLADADGLDFSTLSLDDQEALWKRAKALD